MKYFCPFLSYKHYCLIIEHWLRSTLTTIPPLVQQSSTSPIFADAYSDIYVIRVFVLTPSLTDSIDTMKVFALSAHL